MPRRHPLGFGGIAGPLRTAEAGVSSDVRSSYRRTNPAEIDSFRRYFSVVRYEQEYLLTKADPQETTIEQNASPTWLLAVRAAESKQATDIIVLDLTGISSFADYFVICTGNNQRQVQAISDEVGLRLKKEAGDLPISLEGYNQAEWILADYGDLLVHIFSPKSREYYGLERLWRNAKTLEIPPE
jgi:ribosome-associated protein